MNAGRSGEVMKVGVNTLFFIPGEVGGTETYLRQTLLAMAEHFPDVSIVLFTNRENDSVLRGDLSAFKQVGFELLDFAASNRYSRIIREQVELPGRVKRSDVDVLWSPGYTAPFFCSCPHVVTIHDMQYKSYPQDMSFPARLVTDLLVNAAAKRCERVIAVSHFSKDEIVKYTGISSDKVVVVHEAANLAFSEVLPAEERREMLSKLIPVDKPYVLFVSNTYPHKNAHTLVRSFGEIMGNIPHNLVMVGNPRLGESEVQKALGSVADKSRIFRLQKLSMEQLAPLYQGCDVFVFPSLYEGFGLPVLEAMLAGVPVVTMKLASIPEVGGDCVLYSDGRDAASLAAAMRMALSMTLEERRFLCEKAVSRAKSFSWKCAAEGTVRSLRSVLPVS